MAAEFERELVNSAGVADGVWYEAGQFNVPFSITIEGINGADRAQVRVSNNPVKPANNVHELQYGADISAAGKVEVTAPFKWVKVRKSAADGAPATTIARLYAQLVH